MSHILIKNIEIIDKDGPFHQKKMDVEILNGKITAIKKKITIDSNKYKEIDGKGKYLSHSWVDMFGDVFTPGREYREELESGIAAALQGGFGTVVMSPNHHPEVYLASHIQQLKRTTAHPKISIEFLGAISKKIEGKELAEMHDMYKSGAIAFSDGWTPVQNEMLLSQALEYVKSFDGLILHIPIHNTLNAGGLMNESENSVAFGISGQPAIAEDISIYNALTLAQYQNSKIHIAGVSTAKGLETIKKFKKQHVQVTCSVSPFHLLYNDSCLKEYDSIYKVTPPIRTEKDRKALIKGIEDGTIDTICSFNKPLSWDEKNKEFEYAKPGMACIQYVWPMLIKAAPHISIEKWMELLVDNPRMILNLKKENLDINTSAKAYTIFDTSTIIEKNNNKSMAVNIPMIDNSFKGYTQVI